MTTFNLTKLIQYLLPVMLRKPVMSAWIYSLCTPLRLIHEEFILFLEIMKLRAYENAQTIVLEDILNKEFDPSANLIYIQDVAQKSAKTHLYTRAEATASPIIIRTSAESVDFTRRVFLRDRNYYESNSGTFKVFIPHYLSPEAEMQIHSRVNSLKIATTKFTIIRYTP